MIRAIAPFLAVAACAAQSTWIVEAGNPAALPNLGSAVAAASDGDIILLRNATEWLSGTLVINKSLRIIGDPVPGGSIMLFNNSPTTIRVQVSAQQSVTLCNLRLGWWLQYSPTVHIDQCAGRVTFQDVPGGSCSFVIDGSDQVVFANVNCMARVPMQVTDSTVVFSDSVLSGQEAAFEGGTPSNAAAQFTDSTALCTNSNLRGGASNTVLSGSLPGSHAISATTSAFELAGSSDIVHGHSLLLAPIISTQSTFVLPPGVSPAITGTATTTIAELPSVTTTGFALGSSSSLTVQSITGSLSGLVFGLPGNRIPVPGVMGDLWIDPFQASLPLAGVQNGALTWTIAIPATTALYGQEYRWQAIAALNGALVLSAPGATLLR
ncbi:MAG: hypothetical protein ACI89X_005118 [Planctomycetota bacterium]|jgi:hypothetical protein